MKKKLCTLKYAILFVVIVTGVYSHPTFAEKAEKSVNPPANKKSTFEMFEKIRTRSTELKYKWDLSILNEKGWEIGGYSVEGYPLLYWSCGPQKAQNTSLVLSAVHGDEVTPVYFGFRLVEWLKARPDVCENKRIVVAPFVNPDGFFRYSKGTRTNFNKVDLNRNFDTPDWAEQAQKIWKAKYKSARRYYPGDAAGSEPETKFQQWIVEQYRPAKILTVHAPLNMLDYDGPVDTKSMSFMKTYVESCDALKDAVAKATPDLRYFSFGFFPGSLGNYAGRLKGIPVLTVELPTTDASLAAHYFSILENGTRIFFEYELKESPLRSAAY